MALKCEIVGGLNVAVTLHFPTSSFGTVYTSEAPLCHSERNEESRPPVPKGVPFFWLCQRPLERKWEHRDGGRDSSLRSE
jgi:hypothetical protein